MKNTKEKITRKSLKIFFLILAIALVGVIGFYIFNPRKAIKLAFPDLNEITFIKAVIKNDSAFSNISMVLQNKNPYKLVIDTIDFEILLNDTSIAHQTVALNIKQARYEIDTVMLPLNLHIKQVMGIIRNLQGQDSTSFEAKGFIVYQTIFGRTKIDFDTKNTIRVPIPPQMKVLKVERKGFNFKEKKLKIIATVEIINKGKELDLQLTDVRYNLTVKNTLQSNGLAAKELTIKPESSIILNIPIEIEVYNPLKTAWLVSIDKDQLNYSLRITGKVKENVSSKTFNSDAEIVATGVLELVK